MSSSEFHNSSNNNPKHFDERKTKITYFQILNLSSKTGWMDFFKPPTFNKNGSHFIYIAPQLQKDANDSYQHLTMVSVETGKQTALTSGEFVVFELLHWNDDTDTVFYSANEKNAPYIKHIYSKQLNNATAKAQCLTCNITISGVKQTYFGASFSPEGNYVVITNEGPTVPRTDICKIPSQNSSNLLFIRKIVHSISMNCLFIVAFS